MGGKRIYGFSQLGTSTQGRRFTRPALPFEIDAKELAVILADGEGEALLALADSGQDLRGELYTLFFGGFEFQAYGGAAAG